MKEQEIKFSLVAVRPVENEEGLRALPLEFDKDGYYVLETEVSPAEGDSYPATSLVIQFVRNLVNRLVDEIVNKTKPGILPDKCLVNINGYEALMKGQDNGTSSLKVYLRYDEEAIEYPEMRVFVRVD